MLFIQLGIFLAFSHGSPSTNVECQYDRSKMLALDQTAFDQDMNGGWRQIAKAGCDLVAADLIEDWRIFNGISSSTLFWHEGQLRAAAGQSTAAAILLERARKPDSEDAGWGWNFYVDGTIAFLSGDKAALVIAREKLSKLPEHEGLKDMKDVHGNPAKIKWPMNLHVLDGFIHCWGQSYKEAYACPLPTTAESKRAP